MKVLLYNDFKDHVGGVETFVHEVSHGLRDAGIQVKNVSFLDKPQLGNPLVEKVRGVCRRHLPSQQAFQKFHEAIEVFRPDIIHLQNNNIFTQGILKAVLRHNIPVISSFHDHQLLGERSGGYRSLKYRLKKRLLNGIRNVSTGFACHSFRMKNLMEKNGFTPVTHIPYFVDLKKWSFHPGIHRNPNQLSFVGRIHPDKGIFVWIEAIFQLLPNIPDLQLVCIGEGTARSQLEKIIHQKSMGQHIKVMGHRSASDILAHFHASRALVFPSVYEEMFGIAGIEAQAAGLPVIATRVGGISEWCQDRKTGFLVAPNNPVELANTIKWALDNPRSCQEIAAAARDSVQQKFTKEHSLGKLIGLYEKTVFGQRKDKYFRIGVKIPG